MLTLVQLEYFIAVVECGGVTAAAKKRFITQPALSKQIRLLEEELNCRLFIRESNRLRLSEAGEFLFERAKRLVSGVQNLAGEMDSFLHRVSGRLRIGCGAFTAQTMMPTIVSGLLEKYPGIRPEIVEYGTDEAVAALLAGELDVIFASWHGNDPKLRFTELFRSELVLVFPPGSGLSKRKNITAEALKQLPFITYSAGVALRECIERIPLLSGLPAFLTARNTATVLTYVRRGLGFAAVPAYTLPSEASGTVVVRRFARAPELKLGYIEEAVRSSSPLVRALIELTFSEVPQKTSIPLPSSKKRMKTQ